MNKKVAYYFRSIGAFLVVTPLLLVFCTPSLSLVLRCTVCLRVRSSIVVREHLVKQEITFWKTIKFCVVVQDKGFSRGFGIYGGSIIDADLVRTRSGNGRFCL